MEMGSESEPILENAIKTGVFFQLLHPLERIVYNVNTLCNQIAEKRLWEKLRPVVQEDLEKGIKKNYGINQLSLREMKAITIQVLNREEIRRELETAAVLRCLLCGKKLGRWYVTINDRRVERTRRDEKVSEDQTVFEGVVPGRVEDNEEYCYVLRGAADYWEAITELIGHMVQDHGVDLGKRLLLKEEFTEEELFGLVCRLVAKSIEQILKQEALVYERISRAGAFPSGSLTLERQRVRRKKILTPGRIQRAYTETGDLREALLKLELFEEGYYDIGMVYRDAPSAEEMSLYRESGVKPSYDVKVRRRPYLRCEIWEKLRSMAELGENDVPVKIFCEKCGRGNGESFSSMEELVAHFVHRHPEVSWGRDGVKKILRECTPLGWLDFARRKTCRDVFAYLGPHYVDMLPPGMQGSCFRYGYLTEEKNRVYELYTRSCEPYRKYLLEGRKKH
jgi:DNA-directed RNA polymerase subunit N (RpoN/RPB10)